CSPRGGYGRAAPFFGLRLTHGGLCLACPALGARLGAKTGNFLDRLPDLLGGDQPRAFELPWRPGMARAPQKIMVVEAVVRVVPAAVAGVIVDDPVGRRE